MTTIMLAQMRHLFMKCDHSSVIVYTNPSLTGRTTMTMFSQI